MAHYRKIDTRILLDQKVNSLSSDARLVFLHLLVHINLTSLGAMRASVPGLADELHWEVARFEPALNELCHHHMVRYDQTARFLWLPQFLKYNVPESPNVVKSWETAFGYLPESPLRDALVVHVKQLVSGLSLPFQEALPACFDIPLEPSRRGERVAPSVSQSDPPRPTTPSVPFVGNAITDSKPNVGGLFLPLATGWTNLSQKTPMSFAMVMGEITHASQTHPSSQPLPSSSVVDLTDLPFKSLDFIDQPPFQSPPNPLSKGSAENQTPLPESLNIKPGALSIKQEQEQEQKEKEIRQENNSNQKNNPGEIKNIVAPARQKKLKPPDSKIFEVFHTWQQTLGHPLAQLDVKRRRCIGNALASGYSVAQLCEAIRGCSLTPHNLGDNERGQRYDGLQVILRDADQIDRFIRNAHSPPRRRTQADRLWADSQVAGDRWMALYNNDEEKVIHAID